MFSVEVRNRIVGRSQVEHPLPNVAIDILNEKITVSQLIHETVSELIDTIIHDLGYDENQVIEVLERQYLTESQVHDQATKGRIKVQLDRQRKQDISPIHKQVEIQKAKTAFKDSAYLIIVDGEQMDDLKQVVILKPTSKVTFIRLTPLVGG